MRCVCSQALLQANDMSIVKLLGLLLLLPWTLIKMTRKFFKMLLELAMYSPVRVGWPEVLASVIKIKTGMFIF